MRCIFRAIAALIALHAPGDTVQDGLTKIELWRQDEAGYKMYRIPGIVITKAGTILAYTEARRHTGSDWDTIDIVLRRSTDDGKTFSPQQVIAHAPDVPRSPVALERKQGRADDVTYNNPVAIADSSGAVHFLFCREYMRVFYMRSDDNGVTFTPPTEITAAFDEYRRAYAWRIAATGPGHGIQLANGRLIVPIWLALGTGGNGHHPSVNSTIYSDDGGRSWHAGDIAVPNTPETPDPNETTAVQLANRSVMLNVRTTSPKNRRAVVTSKDGAHHWSAARFQEDLPDPICFASLVRFTTRKTDGKNRLLFSNPDNLSRVDGKDNVSKDRRNLTIHLSYDEGKSWPIKKTIEGGSSGYSDLAVLPDGTMLCLYEAGGSFPHEKLVLARFTLDWLTDRKDFLTKQNQKRPTN
jgi:sialidase-1